MSDYLGVKCTKFDFGYGSAPDPIWGIYRAHLLVTPPDPWLHLRDPTSKGGKGKERGQTKEKRRIEKEFAPIFRSMPLDTDSWSDDTDKNFASKPTV